VSGQLTAETKAVSTERHFGFPQIIQSANYLSPFPILSFFRQAFLQLGLQKQSQKTAKNMTADCLVAFMINRPRIQDRLGGADYIFNHPQAFVNQSNFFSRIISVCSQYPHPIKTFFIFNPIFINAKMSVPFHFQKPPIASVPNQTFIALFQLVPQMGNNRLPVMGVLTSFFLIQANNIAALFQNHLPDF